MATATSPSSKPRVVEDLSESDRLIVASALVEMERRGLRPDGTREAALIGPRNDAELLEAIRQLTGYQIPYVSVCHEHGHIAPGVILCDLYFDRRSNVLCIGNRGGGKTALSGALHGSLNRFKPGFTSAVAGAQRLQGQRAYAEFKKFIRTISHEIVDSLMQKTVWTNGSETEVLGGTPSALNGPHPVLAQMDELELSTSAAFEEFLNMAQSTAKHQAKQLLTSTRKRSFGLVQKIVKDVDEEIKAGMEPSWDVCIFCVFETMENVPNCQTAPENIGRPACDLCECDRHIKGTWDNGDPRTFASVCNGRAARAQGFVPWKDVVKRFRQLSRMTWEAQQECLRPNVEGIVHKWVQEKHAIQSWFPDPAFGPVYRSWDWGGTNPHAILYHQLLKVPVLFNPTDPDDEENARLFPEGAVITFDELYVTDGCGYYELGQRVLARDAEWQMFGFPMVIEKDVCDPAGAAAKADVKKAFRDAGLEEPSFSNRPIDVATSVRKHIEWGDDDRLYYVMPMCPNMDDEYTTYHWPEDKPGKNPDENPAKEDDHAMDSARYLVWYLHMQGMTARVREVPGSDRQARDTPEPRDPKYAPPKTVTPAGLESPVASTKTAGSQYSRQPGDGSTRLREIAVPRVR